jgi:hypothetical protein
MTVKNCIVHDLNFVVDVEKLFDVLKIIFHVVTLSDITDNSCVEPLG